MTTFSIQTADQNHISELARIHLASKRAAERDIVDADFLASKTQEEYEEKWTLWLDEEGIDVLIIPDVGFVSYGRMQTPPPGTSKIRPLYSAEIFAIYVHPDHWREGAGKALIKSAVKALQEDKHKSLCLWALKGNKNANGFYDHLKGQRLGKRQIEAGPTKTIELCYGWRDLNIILQS